MGFAKYFAKRNELVRIENAPSDKWAAINTDAGADADADTGADADVGADADAITDADADTDAGGRWTLESLATSDVANKFAKVCGMTDTVSEYFWWSAVQESSAFYWILAWPSCSLPPTDPPILGGAESTGVSARRKHLLIIGKYFRY